MSIGERLRSIRTEKGLTRKMLAELSGVAEVSISQYELGKRYPRVRQLSRLAQALDISIDRLLDVEMDEKSLSALDRFPEMVVVEPINNKIQLALPKPENAIDSKTAADLLIKTFERLTSVGQFKVLDYARDLSKLTEYRKGDDDAQT